MPIRGIITFVAVLLAGCLSRDRGTPPSEVSTAPAEMRAPQAPDALRALGYVQDKAAPVAAPSTAPPTAAVPTPVLGPLKLIRTGQIALEVSSAPQAAEAIQRLATELGGYVAETRAARQSPERQGGSLTLRVPAERFAAAIAAVKSLGKVLSESTSTQDVTKAYTDIETRLRVKREAASRVQEILKTRTAGLSDVLEAERELARLTEEIEQMEGERRYYDQQIALSTIAVSLQEPAPVLTSGQIGSVTDALRDSFDVLAVSMRALIYIVAFLAPWMLVALVLWKILRWVRGRRRSTAPSTP